MGGQRYNGFQPEFGHPCRARYMNVLSNFFPTIVGDIDGASGSIYLKLQRKAPDKNPASLKEAELLL
jgi:hypothetical protein